jgi:hypothetical protein
MLTDRDGNQTPSKLLISVVFTSGMTMAYLIGKDIFARFSANRPSKNSPTLSATLTPEQIKFKEIEKKINHRILQAYEEDNFSGDDFLEFRRLAIEASNKKNYTIALSTTLLECIENSENAESLERYNFCLAHNNAQAPDKAILQPKEPSNSTNNDKETQQD